MVVAATSVRPAAAVILTEAELDIRAAAATPEAVEATVVAAVIAERVGSRQVAVTEVLYEVDVKTKVKVRGEKGVLIGTPFSFL
jgi:hypothetical protein